MVCGVADLYARKKECEWFPRHGLVFRDDKYFNSGVILLNLGKMRHDAIVVRAMKFVLSNPDVNFADQTALNATLTPDEISIVPAKWNVFSGLLSAEDLKNGVVIHYANELPWIRDGVGAAITDTILLWHQCNALARNISVFKSLRMFFTLRKILCARGLFLCAVWPFTRNLFYSAIKIAGNEDLAQRCRAWYRRLTWPGLN